MSWQRWVSGLAMVLALVAWAVPVNAASRGGYSRGGYSRGGYSRGGYSGYRGGYSRVAYGGYRGGYARGFYGGYGRGYGRGWYGGYGRGWYGGYGRGWYGGYGRGWYGGYGRGWYRPWYGYGLGWYYPSYYYPDYSYYSPSYTYYSSSYYDYSPSYYSAPYYDSYPAGPSSDPLPYVDQTGTPFQPVIRQAATRLYTSAPWQSPDGTYRYDGGPDRLIPVPAARSQPQEERPARADGDSRFVSRSMKKVKFTYPAYGEKPRRPASEEPILLIKKTR